MPSSLFFGITSGDYIKHRLVTEDNPNGTITNSDLELAGGLLHLEALTQALDITERTVLSKGDNLSTTFWEQKGSTSSDKHPAYLLRPTEFTNVSTATPHSLTTFLEPPTTLLMHCLAIFILLGMSSLLHFHLICPRMSDINFGTCHHRYFPL
jgi:hypothetical protein